MSQKTGILEFIVAKKKTQNFTESFNINITGTDKAPSSWSLKTETCRSGIIVCFNVNSELLTKLINS